MKNVTHPFHEWLTNHKNMGTYYTKNNNTAATEKDKYGKEGEWDTKEDGFMDESVWCRKCCRLFDMSFEIIWDKIY